MKSLIAKGLTLSQAKLRQNILMLALLITGIVSIIIAILAYFGINMGTFVISLDDSAYRTGISLSTEPEFIGRYPNLLVNPLNGAEPIGYVQIRQEDVINTNGDYDDPDKFATYIAYTFYLKNEGETTVDLNFEINITKATNKLDSALRVMLIETDVETGNRIGTHVYLKDDENDIYEVGTPERAKVPESYLTYFNDDFNVTKDEIINFRPEKIKKYSIIIWLEGYDVDCKEHIKSGQLKMSLNFEVAGSYKEEDK